MLENQVYQIFQGYLFLQRSATTILDWLDNGSCVIVYSFKALNCIRNSITMTENWTKMICENKFEFEMAFYFDYMLAKNVSLTKNN